MWISILDIISIKSKADSSIATWQGAARGEQKITLNANERMQYVKAVFYSIENCMNYNWAKLTDACSTSKRMIERNAIYQPRSFLG